MAGSTRLGGSVNREAEQDLALMHESSATMSASHVANMGQMVEVCGGSGGGGGGGEDNDGCY